LTINIKGGKTMNISPTNLRYIYWDLDTNKKQNRDYIMPLPGKSNYLNTAHTLSKLQIKKVTFFVDNICSDEDILFQILDIFSGNSILLFLESGFSTLAENKYNLIKRFDKINIIIDFCENLEILKQQVKIIQYMENNKLDYDVSIMLDEHNYKKLDFILNNINFIKENNILIQMKCYTDYQIQSEDILDFINYLYKIKNAYRNLNIQVTSFEHYISEKLKRRSIIENLYIDSEGYVGVFNYLPTYYENISENDVLTAWIIFATHYFNQDIKFLYSENRLLNKLRSKNDFLDKFDHKRQLKRYIPILSKGYIFQKSNGTYYLVNYIKETNLKINEVGVEVIKRID